MRTLTTVGAVAIGRNEGARLARCLKSLAELAPRVIYVDSGSIDGSVELARSWGAEIVQLDPRQGFTAGRARNAGFRRLREIATGVEFVQFVDGDCQIVEGWLPAALAAMEAEPRLAVACGRRRERHPEQSIYNRLCDMEWNTPIGAARACGGDALMRVAAVCEVDGYDERVIAGEEPEMCVRLRRQGWTIRRLDQDMSLHDAAMTRATQWLRRHQRAGHAYAQGAALHGRPPERLGVRQSMSIWFWALVWPLMTALFVSVLGVAGWLALLPYPLMIMKIASRRRRQFHDPWSNSLLYGLACVLSKWPQLIGQLRFLRDHFRGGPAQLIEYKQS